MNTHGCHIRMMMVRISRRLIVILALSFLLIRYDGADCTTTSTIARQSNKLHRQSSRTNVGVLRTMKNDNDNDKIIATLPTSLSPLCIRGGASKSKSSKRKKSGARTGSIHSSSSSQKTATGKKKVGASLEKQQLQQKEESAWGNTLQKYKKILPLTRIYITMVGVSTALGLVLGEEMTQTLLSLDPIRTIYGFELWRPFTAACFLGPPSIGWLMNGYYLFQYGSTLEKAYGSAQHLLFLFSQIIILSILSILLGQPFFASSMITSMLHVLSRSMPYQNVKWLVFTVPYWSLPYGLMATDVLQAQSATAAVPHVLGILAGHFYQFHKFIWPKMDKATHVDWLVPPAFVLKKLDPQYKDSSAKDSLNQAIKDRKQRQKKGRKLGSSTASKA